MCTMWLGRFSSCSVLGVATVLVAAQHAHVSEKPSTGFCRRSRLEFQTADALNSNGQHRGEALPGHRARQDTHCPRHTYAACCCGPATCPPLSLLCTAGEMHGNGRDGQAQQQTGYSGVACMHSAGSPRVPGLMCKHVLMYLQSTEAGHATGVHVCKHVWPGPSLVAGESMLSAGDVQSFHRARQSCS